MKRIRISVLFLSIFFFVGQSIFAARHDDSSLAVTAIKKVAPSIVFIRALVRYNEPVSHVDAFEGTGIIVSKDGFILTNAHVILDKMTAKKHDKVEVQVGRLKYLPARIVGINIETDLALLKIDLPASWEKLVPVKFSEDLKLILGAAVFKAGFPGSVASREPTFAHGMVTNARSFWKDFSIPYGTTDTNISRGDSGGPLFNTRGEVVGINKGGIFDSGGAKEGIGYFVPVGIIVNTLPKLYKGDVHTGWLGFFSSGCINMQDINNDDYLKSELGIFLKTTGIDLPQTESGILIVTTPEKNIGDSNFLKSGDVIISINSKIPQDRRELIQWIAEMDPGSEVLLKIIRKGTHMLVRLKVGEFDWILHAKLALAAQSETEQER